MRIRKDGRPSCAPATVQAAIDCIRTGRRATTRQVAEAAGISAPDASHMLRALAKLGVVRRHGAGRGSPAIWTIPEVPRG